MKRLFLKDVCSYYKILNLEVRELYFFIIDNKKSLVKDVRSVMDDETLKITFNPYTKIEKPTGFPQEFLFTYDILKKD